MEDGTFVIDKPYHVHKSYIFVAPVLTTLLVVVVALLQGAEGLIQLYFAFRDQAEAIDFPLIILGVMGALLLLFAVVIGFYAWSYKHMTFMFGNREFHFHSGILIKHRVHLPYERIQSVNHRASLVQRLVGVCTVVIESAGGSSNKAIRIPYVTLQTAEAMRRELFIRKGAMDSGVAAGVPVGAAAAVPNVLDAAVAPVAEWRGAFGGAAGAYEEPVTFSYGLTGKELFLACITHPTPLVVAIIIGLCSLVAAFIADDFVSAFLALAAIPLSFAAMIFVWALGSVTLALSYGGFKVRRRGTRIEVERGVINRSFSGIAVERIQSIEIRQSFLRRILGYCELSLGRIDSANRDNSQNKGNSPGPGLLIHPFLKLSAAEALLDGLIPEFSDRPRLAERTSLPKPALGRALRRRCLWFNGSLWLLVLGGLGWGLGTMAVVGDPAAEKIVHLVFGSIVALLAVLFVILTALLAVGAVLWARQSGYTWNRRYLLLHNDGLSTATNIIPRTKIQSGSTGDNPFQRHRSLTTLRATTASGVSSTTAQLVDVSAENGAAYLDWLR